MGTFEFFKELIKGNLFHLDAHESINFGPCLLRWKLEAKTLVTVSLAQSKDFRLCLSFSFFLSLLTLRSLCKFSR